MRVQRKQQVKVAHKPQITNNSLFPRTKAQIDADRLKSGLAEMSLHENKSESNLFTSRYVNSWIFSANASNCDRF